MSMLIVFFAGIAALIADWMVNLRRAREEHEYPKVCKHCGGTMVGDGYEVVVHCEFAEWESYAYETPDSSPVYCGNKDSYPFIQFVHYDQVPGLVFTLWVGHSSLAVSLSRYAACYIIFTLRAR